MSATTSCGVDDVSAISVIHVRKLATMITKTQTKQKTVVLLLPHDATLRVVSNTELTQTKRVLGQQHST